MMVLVAGMRLVVMVRLMVAASLLEQLALLLVLLLLHQLGQLAGRGTPVGGMGLVRLALLLLRGLRLDDLLLDAALGAQECACDPNRFEE